MFRSSRLPLRILGYGASVFQISLWLATATIALSRNLLLDVTSSSQFMRLAVVAWLISAAIVVMSLFFWVRSKSKVWYRVAATLISATVAVVAVTPAFMLFQTQETLSNVFPGSAQSSPVAPAPKGTVRQLDRETESVSLTSVVPASVAPASVAPASVAPEDRWNILLLGGDAAPGRYGTRTDAMALISIDQNDGDVLMVSIPRNIERMKFGDSELANRFPEGFSDMANAIFQYAMRNPEVNPFLDNDIDRGGWGISTAVADFTGLHVDDWVYVDMAAFIDVVDAVGDLEIFVPKRIPAPGNPPGAKHPVPAYFEEGWSVFDGTLALAYARSRKADSDYVRIERQRCVLAALGAELKKPSAVSSLLGVLDALQGTVRTSISQSEIGDLVEALELISQDGVRTLSLAPPLVKPSNPNIEEVNDLVAAAIAGPQQNVVSTVPSSEPVISAPPTSTVPSTPATLSSVPISSPDLSAEVLEACQFR